MNKKGFLFLILVISIGLNAILGYYIYKNNGAIDAVGSLTAENKKLELKTDYPYLSKRIQIEDPNDVLINFLPLRTQLEGMAEPWDTDFGLYFEYLPTGVSIGVNRDLQFYAASLFKVPVVMAYYHYLERTGISRDQEIIIEKEDIDSQFGDLYRKGAGAKINSNDAIKLALEQSDNTAAKVIAKQVNQKDFDDVFSAIGLDLLTGPGGAIMTVREYGTILKALYFSAVLDKNDSNEILKYLTQSKFDDKLVAGVGRSVPIAHKIGDYRDSKGEKAFYDCGIVFLPKRNYLLCMSSTSDEDTTNIRMSQVSKAVYEYVSKQE